jgi:hypothetical protein
MMKTTFLGLRTAIYQVTGNLFGIILNPHFNSA